MNQNNIFAFTPADAGGRPPYVSLNECSGELVLTMRGYSGGGSVAPTDQVVVSIDDVRKMAAGLNAYLAASHQPAAAPVADIEAAAKAIYDHFPPQKDGSPSTHPWRDGGNSNMQDIALRMARAAFESQPSAALALSSGGVKPAGFDVCPISGREFWGNIDHPERGELATYGGPFDTYSIPYLDDDGELRVERFDQDRGEWIEGGEPYGWFYDEQQPEPAAVPAEQKETK